MFDIVTRWDAEKGGAGAGGGDSTSDTTNIPASTKASETLPEKTSTGGEKPGSDGGEEQIRLTPAQLAERLDRAKGAERSALLTKMGFESPDALQKALEDGKKALQAQMSEQERQAEALRQAEERSQALEKQAKDAQEAAQAALLQSEALALMAGRFANPKAAYRLLDLSNVKQDDGVFEGLSQAIDKLATDDPWTLAQPAKKQLAPAIGATNPEGEQKRKESDVERRARYFGNYQGGGSFFEGGGVKVDDKKT